MDQRDTTFKLGVAKVVVTEHDQSVAALDDTGRVLARFPATVGSEHDSNASRPARTMQRARRGCFAWVSSGRSNQSRLVVF
jgi:hypothetical protein